MNTRRNFLKQTATTVAALSLTPAFSFSIIHKKKPVDDLIIGHGDYRYKVHKDWAQISPVHTPLLNCHEMVMDQKGIRRIEHVPI